MRILMVAMVLAMTCPASAVEDIDGTYAKLSETARKRLDEIMLWRLFDPESARLRNLHVSKRNFVCGLINAKNEQGGYAGYKSFYIDLAPSSFKFHVSEVPKTSSIGSGSSPTEVGPCDKE